jgi:hypothetical protein
MYSVRFVRFRDRRTPVVLQSKNGPCPLLAVVNALLLRGSLTLDADTTAITFAELSILVKGYVEQRLQKFVLSGGKQWPVDGAAAVEATGERSASYARAGAGGLVSTPAQRVMAARGSAGAGRAPVASPVRPSGAAAGDAKAGNAEAGEAAVANALANFEVRCRCHHSVQRNQFC